MLTFIKSFRLDLLILILDGWILDIFVVMEHLWCLGHDSSMLNFIIVWKVECQFNLFWYQDFIWLMDQALNKAIFKVIQSDIESAIQ